MEIILGEDVSMTFIVAKRTIYLEDYFGDNEDDDYSMQPKWSILKGHRPIASS